MSRLPLLILAALLAAAPAFAGGKVDFSGVWKLDPKASDSVDALLKAAGRSWIERRAAETARVTQTITQTEEAVTVAIDSTLADRTEVLRLDGAPVTATSLKGRPVTSWTTWSADGLALITRSEEVSGEGERIVLVVTRTLEDGGRTMRQRLELRRQDGTTLRADRIFRRADGG